MYKFISNSEEIIIPKTHINKFDYFIKFEEFESNKGSNISEICVINVEDEVLNFIKNTYNDDNYPFTKVENIICDFLGYKLSLENKLLSFLNKKILHNITNNRKYNNKFQSLFKKSHIKNKLSKSPPCLEKKSEFMEKFDLFENYVSKHIKNIVVGGESALIKYKRKKFINVSIEQSFEYYIYSNKEYTKSRFNTYFQHIKCVFLRGLKESNLEKPIFMNNDEKIIFTFNEKTIIIYKNIFKSKSEILNLLSETDIDCNCILRTLDKINKYYTNNRGLLSIKNKVNTVDFSNLSVNTDNKIMDATNNGYSVYILFFDYYKSQMCRDANFNFVNSNILKNIFCCDIYSFRYIFDDYSKYSLVKHPKLILPSFNEEIKIQQQNLNIKLEKWSNLYTLTPFSNKNNNINIKFESMVDILKRCGKNLPDTSESMFTNRTINIETYLFGDIPYSYIIKPYNFITEDIIFVCLNEEDKRRLLKFIQAESKYVPKIIVAKSYEILFSMKDTENIPKFILKINEGKLEIYAKDRQIWEIENAIIPKYLYNKKYSQTGFRVLD